MEQVPLSPAGLEPAWNADPLAFMQGLRPLSPFAPPAPRALLASDCFQPAFLDIPRPSADVRVPVLVATGPSRPPPLFGLGLLASRHRAGRLYEVAYAQMNSLSDLEALCRLQAPRLLLVDIALISPERVNRLDDLRRRFPTTDWLLGWESPSLQGLDAAIRSQIPGRRKSTGSPWRNGWRPSGATSRRRVRAATCVPPSTIPSSPASS